MNVFEEFKHILNQLALGDVNYALIGGIAMAFYTEPRFTRDIDVLVPSEDFAKAKQVLVGMGYFESAAPWRFTNVAIELHRFHKVRPDDELMVDILVAKDERVRDIIKDAVEAESIDGKIRLASRTDLLWLKKQRFSKQDQADIEKLGKTQK